MLTQATAHQFAHEWIAAWNSHDLNRVLEHYTDDFEMSTPFIAKIMNEPSGTLYGKEAVKAYWQQALQKIPDLHFELIEVLYSVDSLCIYYNSVLGLRAVEWLLFDRNGKVRKAIAHYNHFELP
ncbi:MAG: nuclear transport factor 2 family protein [Mastigocladus sp. ERB_26_2]